MAILVDLSKRKRATVRPDGSAGFRCPACGVSCVLKPDVPVRPSSPVRTFFRCECGIGHTVYLCTRAARTAMDTHANLFQPRSNIRLPARVQNVSRSGMLLALETGAPLRVGDEIVLQFDIPLPSEKRFFKHATVRRVDEFQVGAEFLDAADHDFERALTACCAEFAGS